MQLPTAVRSTLPRIVRLSFQSTVYQGGSTFGIEVANSSDREVWQSADPGDVVGDDLAAGSGLTVLTPLGIGSVRLEGSPGVFSPNGDGINDEAVFAFVVLNINVERQARVDIHDLRGRRVRSLTETRASANGAYRLLWDGLDDDGNLVAPGVYLARIHVETDGDGDEGAAVVVGVAY